MDNKKTYTIEEKILYWRKQLDEHHAAWDIMEELFKGRANFIIDRLNKLESGSEPKVQNWDQQVSKEIAELKKRA